MSYETQGTLSTNRTSPTDDTVKIDDWSETVLQNLFTSNGIVQLKSTNPVVPTGWWNKQSVDSPIIARSGSGWDSTTAEQACAISVDGTRKVMYLGDSATGLATGPDFDSLTKSSSNPIITASDTGFNAARPCGITTDGSGTAYLLIGGSGTTGFDIWSAPASDLTQFSFAEYFDTGFDVLSGGLWKHNGTYYAIIEEKNGRNRYLRLYEATDPTTASSWSQTYTDPVRFGTASITSTPTVVPIDYQGTTYALVAWEEYETIGGPAIYTKILTHDELVNAASAPRLRPSPHSSHIVDAGSSGSWDSAYAVEGRMHYFGGDTVYCLYEGLDTNGSPGEIGYSTIPIGGDVVSQTPDESWADPTVIADFESDLSDWTGDLGPFTVSENDPVLTGSSSLHFSSSESSEWIIQPPSSPTYGDGNTLRIAYCPESFTSSGSVSIALRYQDSDNYTFIQCAPPADEYYIGIKSGGSFSFPATGTFTYRDRAHYILEASQTSGTITCRLLDDAYEELGSINASPTANSSATEMAIRISGGGSQHDFTLDNWRVQ